MKKIILATTNLGKIREFNHLFSQLSISIETDSSLPSVEETGKTFIENALIKARNAALHTNRPSIADDSGIVVPALGHTPGIYSARYAGLNASSEANNKKLLSALTNIKDKSAYFYCAIAFLPSFDSPCPIISTGIWHGRILEMPQGEDGFGYDPLFFVPRYKKTAAELPIEIKNSISHRAKALSGLIPQFKARFD